MPRAEAQLETRLPVPIGEPRVIQTKGQKYLVLAFAEGKGPTLSQTIEMTKRENEKRKGEGMPLVKMLTLNEGRAIRDNDESDVAFRKTLKPGEWTHVRDSKSEKRSRAAYLVHSRDYRGLVVDDNGRPDDAAPVMVWKEVGSEAAAPQARLLRVGAAKN